MALDYREFTQVKSISEQMDLLQAQRAELSASIHTFRELASETWEKSIQFNGLFREITLLMVSTEALRKDYLEIQKTSHTDKSSK